MCNRSVWQVAAGIVTLGVLSGTTTAQHAEQPGMLSVQFPGGTVAEYVEALREAVKPEPANIALSERAAVAILPPVRLEKVTVGTALGAIEFIAPSNANERWVIAPLSRQGPGEPEAYAVTLAQMQMGGPAQYTQTVSLPDEERVLQVFSLKEVIDGMAPQSGRSPDTVLSAVELALQMGARTDDDPADVKFHADSGLLIINASREEVGSVAELLQRMRDDVMREQGVAQSVARRRIDDELNVNVAQAKREACEARLAFTADAVMRLKQLHEGGQTPIEEVRRAELERLNAESDLDIVTAELQAARARMEPVPGPSSPRTADLQAEVARLRDQVSQMQAKIKELEAKKK
jgi:hypothetical protein